MDSEKDSAVAKKLGKESAGPAQSPVGQLLPAGPCAWVDIRDKRNIFTESFHSHQNKRFCHSHRLGLKPEQDSPAPAPKPDLS